MLWRLPGSIRSLVLTASRRYSSTATPTRASDPLRILFCGSDEFSIASLRALTEAKRHVPNLIDSIDVVHRPAKPTGKGLKTLREVPIKQVASEELKLNTHAIDTFTGWTPPTPTNLIIAVSFGLFVPPRILNYAKYGGLNVHPSLLPDLKGAAPIQHAVLKRRKYTGVSIQTLHPQHFDQGTILAQTPAPGIYLPREMTAKALEGQLANIGAEMLVDVLTSRKFVPPLDDVGWYADSRFMDHAPKITKQDRFIDFKQSSIEDLLAVQYALGDPWCLLPNGDRLILHKVVYTGKIDVVGFKPGVWVHKGYRFWPLVRDAYGRVGVIVESTYAGSKAGRGNQKLLQVLPAEESAVDMMTWEGYKEIKD